MIGPGAQGLIEGRRHQGDLELDTDTLIVGSGSSGAVCAAILVESGRRVLVVEEGGFVPPEEYGAFRPSESLRRMFRDGGTTAAVPLGDTPMMSILAGRTVGGSSTLTGGVIFRIPAAVSERWSKEFGLVGYGPREMEPAYEAVEEALSVSLVPEEMRSHSTELFGLGAARLGYSLRPMKRNIVGCRGSSRCNFGCPHRAKLSVDLTYLPRAMSRGAGLVSDCRITSLSLKGDKITGVEGRLLDGTGRRRGKVKIHAREVLLAGSALSTPLLLQGAGVGRRSRQVGRNLSLHPAARVAALFDHDVSGWKGAMQSAYADAFQSEGITLNSIFPPPNIIASFLPGVGPELDGYVKQVGQLATFGMMVHDEGGGRVRRLPGGGGLYTYRMNPRDKATMMKGIRLLAETYLAAGAREVLLPIFGSRPIRQVEELGFLSTPSFPARQVECMTFHPLGSVRMGIDPRSSVVGPTGEAHDVRGLFVVDGSVFPTSVGVNSQLPIMAVATKLAWSLAEDRRYLA